MKRVNADERQNEHRQLTPYIGIHATNARNMAHAMW